MKTVRQFENKLKDESGVITLDFIFAIGIAFGFSILFFAMSFTLSMVEVCQYITFSATRTYYAANTSEPAQIKLGKKKYKEIKSKGIFKTIFSNGWINLGKEIEFRNFSDEYEDQDAGANAIFVGGQVKFTANVLNLHLPFLGSTVTDANSTGSATLNAYLMREVSTEECVKGFTEQRYKKLGDVDGRYGSFGGTAVVIRDNGC